MTTFFSLKYWPISSIPKKSTVNGVSITSVGPFAARKISIISLQVIAKYTFSVSKLKSQIFRMSRDIPGFWRDPESGKYFKIGPGFKPPTESTGLSSVDMKKYKFERVYRDRSNGKLTRKVSIDNFRKALLQKKAGYEYKYVFLEYCSACHIFPLCVRTL